MKLPYIIVVGVDYSEVSRLALREALTLASERPSSELHVVHVETASRLSPGRGVSKEVFAESMLGQAGTATFAEASQRLGLFVGHEVAAFQETRQQPGGASMGRVMTHVRTSAPSREIAQLAADLEADLVVVGTLGRTGLARFVLGSVAHAVVSPAPCAVLVVRPKEIPLVPAIEPPCPRCLEARKQSHGSELWCDQHRARHGQRHTYHQDDRAGQETNFPLVFDER
jgi:nucleotide-binding universal stress UspA family protein